MACIDRCAPVLHDPHRERAFSLRRALLTCAAAVALFAAVVVCGRILAGSASSTDFTAKFYPPSPAHPFGTDWMGRDMLARTVAGLSTSLLLGLAAALVSGVIAFALAAVSVAGGPWADRVVGFCVDVCQGMPHLILIILISYALGRGALGVCAGVALTHWPQLCRVLRAEMQRSLGSPHVAIARRLGRSWPRVVLDHVLPATAAQLVTGLVLLFPQAILHEASVTFLGFGLSPEQPSVGVVLAESMTYLTAGYWWLALIPGACLLMLVLVLDRAGNAVKRLIVPEEVM